MAAQLDLYNPHSHGVEKLSESLDSVKHVIEDLRTWADSNRTPDKVAITLRMDNMVNHLEIVKADLIRLHDLTTALPPDLGNLHDLPTELLAELNVSKVDELEDQLVTVINAYGGEANLDQILVGLYRKFGVSQKRRLVQNKLYRMDMVWSVPGKKGVYTTAEPKEPKQNSDEGHHDVAKGDEIPF